MQDCAIADGWYKVRVFNESVQIYTQTRAVSFDFKSTAIL